MQLPSGTNYRMVYWSVTWLSTVWLINDVCVFTEPRTPVLDWIGPISTNFISNSFWHFLLFSASWTFGKSKAGGGLNTHVTSRLWPRRSTRWRDPSRRQPSFWRPAPSPRCKWRSRWRRPSSGRRAAGTEVGNPSQPFPHRSSLSLLFPALSLYKNQFQYVGWPPAELRAAGPPASCFFFYLNFRSEEVWERHILQLFNSVWAKKVVGTERRLFCLREKLESCGIFY